jgi:hypothetical protein
MSVVNEFVDGLVIAAFNLSLIVVERHVAGKLDLSEEEEAVAYRHCDGMEAKRIERANAIENCSNQRCALRDLLGVEQDLRRDISTMKLALKKG